MVRIRLFLSVEVSKRIVNNIFIASTDIYVASVSNTHCVCAQNYYLAIVSTIVETDNPEAELQPGLKLLGPIKEK